MRGFAVRVAAKSLLLVSSLLLHGCSAIVVAADVAVSAAVTVVGTAADLTVAGVKAVTGSGNSDETKKVVEKR